VKVAFINFYPKNQVITPLLEYSQILSSQKHSVTVFLRKDANIDNIGDCSIFIRKVGREFFSNRLTLLIFIIKLISILRRDKYDIIHVFNFTGASLLPIFCKKSGKWIFDIQSGRLNGGIKGILYNKLINFESKFFDFTIVVSKGLKEKLFRKENGKKIEVIPLGANLRNFQTVKIARSIWKSFGVKPENFILIYIGDFCRARQLENLLEAFKIVCNTVKDKNLRLVLVGGKDEERKFLSKVIQELSIDDKVIFLGFVPYRIIPSLLKNSDIGLSYIPKSNILDVQPPLKTFEYLAASLPIIATNTKAHLEFLKNRENAIISSDDPVDFAKGIIELIDNLTLRLKLRSNAPIDIEKFDWRHICRRLYTVYLKLL